MALSVQCKSRHPLAVSEAGARNRLCGTYLISQLRLATSLALPSCEEQACLSCAFCYIRINAEMLLSFSFERETIQTPWEEEEPEIPAVITEESR